MKGNENPEQGSFPQPLAGARAPVRRRKGLRMLGITAGHGSASGSAGRAPAHKPKRVPAHTDQPDSDDERRRRFEETARPLLEPLYAMALRLQRNATHAEDLVQETLLRAWRNYNRFTAGTNFKAWLFQIMTYLHLNERRSAHHREVATDFGEPDIPTPESRPASAAAEAVAAAAEQSWRDAGERGGAGDGPSVAALREVNWAALYPAQVDDSLKNALDHLPEEQRLVFLLTALGELSYQECADTLAIPVGTVMSRLFRARRQLQDELAEYARERNLATTEGAES